MAMPCAPPKHPPDCGSPAAWRPARCRRRRSANWNRPAFLPALRFRRRGCGRDAGVLQSRRRLGGGAGHESRRWRALSRGRCAGWARFSFRAGRGSARWNFHSWRKWGTRSRWSPRVAGYFTCAREMRSFRPEREPGPGQIRRQLTPRSSPASWRRLAQNSAGNATAGRSPGCARGGLPASRRRGHPPHLWRRKCGGLDFGRAALTELGYSVRFAGHQSSTGQTANLRHAWPTGCVRHPGNPLSHFVCWHVVIRAAWT
jgi:hypothetical protein